MQVLKYKFFVLFLFPQIQAYIESKSTNQFLNTNLNVFFIPIAKILPSTLVTVTNVNNSDLLWNIFPLMLSSGSDIRPNNRTISHCSSYFQRVFTRSGPLCYKINFLKFVIATKPWNLKINIGIPRTIEIRYLEMLAFIYPIDKSDRSSSNFFRSLSVGHASIFILIIDTSADQFVGREQKASPWYNKVIGQPENLVVKARFFIMTIGTFKHEIIELREVRSQMVSKRVSKPKWESGYFFQTNASNKFLSGFVVQSIESSLFDEQKH